VPDPSVFKGPDLESTSCTALDKSATRTAFHRFLRGGWPTHWEVYKVDDAGTIKDIALLVLAALAGLAPGLLDKLGIDMPKAGGRDFDWLIEFGCRTLRVVRVRV
jgi:hypothetical protein